MADAARHDQPESPHAATPAHTRQGMRMIPLSLMVLMALSACGGGGGASTDTAAHPAGGQTAGAASGGTGMACAAQGSTPGTDSIGAIAPLSAKHAAATRNAEQADATQESGTTGAAGCTTATGNHGSPFATSATGTHDGTDAAAATNTATGANSAAGNSGNAGTLATAGALPPPCVPDQAGGTTTGSPLAALTASNDTAATAATTTNAGASTCAPAAGTPPAPPPPPAPKVSVDVCEKILAADKPLPSGMENAQIPERTAPDFQQAIEEPTYHSCVARVTNNDPNSRQPYLRSDYSRRQAFNADSSYMLLNAGNGFWHLYDARNLTHLKVLNGPAGDAEPQWHPTNPNVLWYLNRYGWGMEIHQLDVQTNRPTGVVRMAPQVKALWPAADTAWTRSEGSPSADGRYWCFQAENSATWQTLGAFTWDMQEQRIVGSISLNERPDHVSMSPGGKYCVISSDGRMGTRAYSRDFKTPHPAGNGNTWLQLLSKSEHSDIARLAGGSDAYVAVDYSSGDVFSTNLDTGRRISLFSIYPGRTATAVHISGKAYKQPGWALISTYGEYSPDDMSASLRNTSQQQWLHRKMFAISLDGKNTVRPIAHVDSTIHDGDGVDNYWAEPQATVNQDFTRMLFNSTWNGRSDDDVETWLSAIRPGALTR